MVRLSALKALQGDPEGVAGVTKLMEALDSYVPLPQREVDKPFLMPIEDVFSISGRGTVVTGRVERGKVKVGEEIEIVGFKPTEKKVVTGVEMFRKLLDAGEAGDNIGVLLRGVEKDDVERGQVLAKPGSIKPHTKFKGEVYILSKEEGGRHTPFFNGYRPQFYIRTTDVTGTLNLPEGVEMVMPGDNTTITGELMAPVALEKGARFAIREGGRTVGAGHDYGDRRIEAGIGLRAADPDQAAGAVMRDIIALACTECKRRNYSTTKNKKKTTERLEFEQVLPLLPEAHGAQGDEVESGIGDWRVGSNSALIANALICSVRCDRPVAQLAEHRSPKPGVGGSIPSWPASLR